MMNNPLYKTHKIPVYAQNKIGVSPATNIVVDVKLYRFKKYSENNITEIIKNILDKRSLKLCEKEFLPIVLNANDVITFTAICAKQLFRNYKINSRPTVDIVFSPQNIYNIYTATIGKEFSKKNDKGGTP